MLLQKRVYKFLMISLIFFNVNNLFADDIPDVNENIFPSEFLTEIEKQIYDEDFSSKKIENGVNRTLSKVSQDFKSIVYDIQNEFSIALAFLDTNVLKYFNPALKEVYINYKRNGVNISTMVENAKGKHRARFLFNYKRAKATKAFLPFDESGGFFLIFPVLGEREVQSVVICPRKIEKEKGNSVFENNHWRLEKVYARIFSNSKIITNEGDSKVSAFYTFSKDTEHNGEKKTSEGDLASAKATYDPPVIGIYEKLNKTELRDDMYFSLLSGVEYEGLDGKKYGYRRVSHKIKKIKLKKDLYFTQGGAKKVVKNGDCYLVVSAMPMFDLSQD